MRTAIVFTVLALVAACDEHHRRGKPPSQVPMGDEWRVPADAADGGTPVPRPAPSTQPAPNQSGDEIHI